MTQQAPHPDDSGMTPEMLSNEIRAEAEGKETPENPAPEQKPEEKPADPVPPKEDEPAPEDPKPEEKPEDKKPEDKPEEKPEAPLQPKRTIYEDYKEKKKEVKAKETEIETLKSQLAEKDTLIEDLRKKAESAETPAEKQEISDEIKAIAEDIGADPEGVKKLTDFITRIVKPGETPALSEEDRKALDRVKQSDAERETKAQFAKEWDAFEPGLKKEFPHVTNEDLAVIREVVDQLAHSPQYNTYPVDYIYFKERERLSKLVSPKRPSYEGGDNKPAPEGDADVELSGRSTPMDAQKATRSSGSGSQLEIRPSN